MLFASPRTGLLNRARAGNRRGARRAANTISEATATIPRTALARPSWAAFDGSDPLCCRRRPLSGGSGDAARSRERAALTARHHRSSHGPPASSWKTVPDPLL